MILCLVEITHDTTPPGVKWHTLCWWQGIFSRHPSLDEIADAIERQHANEPDRCEMAKKIRSAVFGDGVVMSVTPKELIELEPK
jgi:hypothetical protein